MKDVELKIISELMKNSRRSDRELAKVIGTSQPTVTRTRTRLEKEGYIKEYTAIPDFARLGYEIMALTFVKLRGTLNPEQIERAREAAKKALKESRYEVIMLERGIGLNFNGIAISYHKSYSAYSHMIEWFKQFTFWEITDIQSFIIDLNDKIRYRPLTLSLFASDLLKSSGSGTTEE